MSKKSILLVTALLLAIVLALVGIARAQELFPGDAIRGGLIYDNWYNALSLSPPRRDHPLWEERKGKSSRSGASTWRCETCHGWDYKGSSGAFGPGTPDYTGFPGIMGVVGDSNEEIMAWLNGLKDPRHDFSTVMDQQALVDLVAFLRTKQVNIALMVDYTTRAALGNSDAGRPLYEQTCAECHGEDGGDLNFGVASSPSFIGDVALNDPWRMVHKVRFGHPGTEMPSSEALGWSLQNVADLLAYTQTLPLGNPPPPAPTGLPEFEITSTQGQGDPRLIIAGAVLIAVTIFSALVGDAIRSRRQQKNP